MKSSVGIDKYLVSYRSSYPNNFKEIRFAVMFAGEREMLSRNPLALRLLVQQL